MDESKYQVALQLILHAGNAKGSAMQAIDAAEAGDFERAQECLESARTAMSSAHELQFDMVQREANGEAVELNIILVHAQDHLTMAIMSIDFAERFVALYQRLQSD